MLPEVGHSPLLEVLKQKLDDHLQRFVKGEFPLLEWQWKKMIRFLPSAQNFDSKLMIELLKF